MRSKSHISLGHYLICRYLPDTGKLQRKIFLLGCIQPDRNPTTYLKGSIRFRWLRGHNYPNASRFITRISRRLERKQYWNLFDFYTLGKLIHYTADAFTSAHNDSFPGDLSNHRNYEKQLEQYFLIYLNQNPNVDIVPERTVIDSIRAYHRRYSIQTADIHRDSHFTLQVCCCVLAILMAPESFKEESHVSSLSCRT